MNPPTSSASGISASTTEVLAATIAAVVEGQLTQYMSVMTNEVEAIRRSADEAQERLRAELGAQIAAVTQKVDGGQSSSEAHHKALQTALEDRLAEFAQHQQRRLAEVENKIIEMPMMVGA